ncbi:MAG: sigma-54-dependent Fis family transcriptional regulator, partial [Rhodospirillales bacterium]|nr:sigma-54-dependent Fis family transcriptional regulator [Rhodospirillales bacterium]
DPRIERAVIVARQGVVDVADLPPYLFDPRAEKYDRAHFPLSLDGEMDRLERRLILEALQRTQGVQVKAADLLGVTERSLWHRIKKLGIQLVRRAERG